TGGLQLAILGSEYPEIYLAAQTLSRALVDRIPEVGDVNISFDTSQPELFFNIDREKANDLGVPMNEISQALRVMVDQYRAIDLSIEDQTVPIVLGSTRGAVDDPGDLLNIFVISRTGELVPLSTLIDVEERGAATQLDRHAQSRAIEMDIRLPPGAPLGDVMARIREVANEVLPEGMNIQFIGEAARLSEASHQASITFLLAIAIVFLVLAAQFESVASALIVIFTVPFGLAAAV